MPAETFERTMRVNMHGAYFMVQAAANQMVKQGDGGSNIAMSSISALVGGEYPTHYTPTKAGGRSLMPSCAIALGKIGICACRDRGWQSVWIRGGGVYLKK